MTDADKVLALRTCLLGVAACFNSRTESSTCIDDHHPSCHEYVTNVLAMVGKEEVVVEEKDITNDDIKFWLAVSDMNKEIQCDKG